MRSWVQTPLRPHFSSFDPASSDHAEIPCFSSSVTKVLRALILLTPEYHVFYGSGLSSVGLGSCDKSVVYLPVLKQKWCCYYTYIAYTISHVPEDSS